MTVDEDLCGLVVGKFWPPHRGHQQLIDAFARACERLFIVVCEAPGQRPTGLQRAWWLQALYPKAEVIVTEDLCAHHHPDPCAPECTPLWAQRVEALGITGVDVVVAGEAYGEAFAEALGAQYMHVDRSRGVAVSGTQIRADLAEHWWALDEVVRAGLYRRVVVLGAESTGTTTLVRDMAGSMKAPYTAEAGRTMSWALFTAAGSMGDIQWDEQHFWTIVEQQIRLEQFAIQGHVDQEPGSLGPWLVCDTDTLATVAWWERYLGRPAPALLTFAQSRLADLYVLTSPDDVEMDETDPLRDGAAVRLAMHERLRELVVQSGRPFVEVTGSELGRAIQVALALAKVEQDHPRWVHHAA